VYPGGGNTIFRSEEFMKRKRSNSVPAAAILAISLAASLPAQVNLQHLQTGRVLAVGISGNGPNPQAKSQTQQRRGDLWWTYSIRAKDRTYVAVSRESPAQTGLTANSSVRFTVSKNQIYTLDSRGKRHVLRVLRQDKTKGCR
jgi:hypothetical protein